MLWAGPDGRIGTYHEQVEGRGGIDAEQSSFGARLRALREAAGMSQEELADRAGLSADAVSSLERGARTYPYPATVRALGEALALSADEQSALFAAVPRRVRGASPHRSWVGARRRALPVPPTPMMGREQDLAAVLSLFRDPTRRLVTLTGMGGIGKTRLAVAVAEGLADSMREGVVFVALAPVLDDRLVLSEIGRALGAGGGPRAVADDAVVSILMERQLLLVLDNAEHLAGAAVVVAGLLARCAELSVLVTSRAPLQIRGETLFPVPPLTLPAAGCRDVSSLVTSPAASLLLERGRAVRADLLVQPSDVPAMVEICRRLSGIPLALELAAAGLRTLQPHTLLDRLDEMRDSRGPVDLPARQQTLRSTLDWSYALLTTASRSAFRRLSVFVGGFSLDAAASVLAGPRWLEAVDLLIAQSLCMDEWAADGQPRFTMLEVVAEYGRSLLVGTEARAAREAHARYFLTVAEAATPGYQGTNQTRWLTRLDLEAGNLSSAFEWTVQQGFAELAGRFAWSLWMYWWMRGRLAWARPLVEELLLLDLGDATRARTLIVAGGIAEPGVDSDRVELRYAEALELALRSVDHAAEASASLALGGIALEQGRFGVAEDRLRKTLPAAERCGEGGRWYIGHAKVLLGAVRRVSGDPAGAVQYIQSGLVAARRRGDGVGTCIALYNLAQASLALGQNEAARRHLLEAVALCQQTQDAANLSFLLDALAAAEAAGRPSHRIATLLGAAAAMREVVGSTAYGFYAADVALRERTAEDARQNMGEHAYWTARGAGQSLSLDDAVELALATDPTVNETGRASTVTSEMEAEAADPWRAAGSDP